jgi:hypothetical protein
MATTTNTLAAGFTLVASAYPVSVTLANLDTNPVDGDEIYVYKDGSYTTYSYIAGMGWLDELAGDASDVVIEVGIGFWYKTSTTRDWVQAIPYQL